MESPKTALITGASSGFGLLTSVTLARRGWRVIAAMRDPAHGGVLQEAARAAGVLGRIEILPLDVTRNEQIEALAARIAARPEPLDAVLNNAGYALAGFVDDISDAELRRQFDTNFFGSVAVTRAFLPQLRRQHYGRIVMVSSISGRCGFPGVASYAASKHALEGWAESLRLELLPLGIYVSLAEPGSFATNIWARSIQAVEAALNPASPNAERVARWRKRLENADRRGDPQLVANGIAKILAEKRPRLRYLFGTDAKMAVFFRALLPWSFYERIVVKQCEL
jgi:NAD(P)-dependent dehydrogenase (short-subunit alcohol dehydrogenase family)